MVEVRVPDASKRDYAGTVVTDNDEIWGMGVKVRS